MTAPIAIAAALLRGGSLRRLATLALDHAWLVLLALLVQLVGIVVLSRTGGSFGWILLIATGIPLIAFLIVNRSIKGMTVIAAGFLLNLLVIAVNGAMPVSPTAARAAGVPISSDAQGPRHEVLSQDTLLPWLGDVIPIPGLATVVSIGDLVLALGVGHMLYRAAIPRSGRKVRTASGSAPVEEP